MILRSDGSVLNEQCVICYSSECRECRNEKRLQAVTRLHQSQQVKGVLYPVLFLKWNTTVQLKACVIVDTH